MNLGSKPSAEKTTFAESHPTHSIYLLDQCGRGISPSKNTISLFADYDQSTKNAPLQGFTGWNHVANGKTSEWIGTKLAPQDYNAPTLGQANESCSNVDTLNIVLVKKYANWEHQHSNGMEYHFASPSIAFGSLSSIAIDLKINSARTSIPDQKKNITTYSPYTDAIAIQQQDTGKVNLGISLYDGTSLNAADIIEVDPSLYGDKWIRVIIDLKNVNYFSEVNYVRNPKTAEDLSKALVKGMLLVGETKTGKVLRGSIKNWNDNIPETFKEMDISIKKIEFTLK